MKKKSNELKPLQRSNYFLAALAMKQNNASFALELVNKTSTYVTERFILLMAFTQQCEFDNACDVLHRTIEKYKNYTHHNKPYFGKQMVC